MTIHTTNGYGPCITDHHDVTEEDMHYANLGDDEFLFWSDFYRPRERFVGRSEEWKRQYYASLPRWGDK